ncbi:MAG TPA: hypothetical protein VMH28_10150 [Candidatus Acidoferrales bacterium]|nr:hypothetical protein [Candidatus Acidoferrales bacterium]
MNRANPRARVSRREVLGLIWLPFFRPGHISLAGARFRIMRNGGSKRRYVLIHGNEESAREVLVRHMQTHDGIAYVIESHTRNVPAGILQFDPNRVFSRAGAEANIARLNPNAAPEAVQHALHLLDGGREKLIRALTPPRGGLTVALHNNSQGYSVADEVPISDQTSLREPGNPHAFFLCTDPQDFEVLKTSPYNVVLQQHAPKTDDGSLSRIAAARGFRYVNLEVGIGHPERQREMISWLEWKLR